MYNKVLTNLGLESKIAKRIICGVLAACVLLYYVSKIDHSNIDKGIRVGSVPLQFFLGFDTVIEEKSMIKGIDGFLAFILSVFSSLFIIAFIIWCFSQIVFYSIAGRFWKC